MSWLAVDKDGTECVFRNFPIRSVAGWDSKFFEDESYVELPQGSIAKLIGRELTWNEEPVELK